MSVSQLSASAQTTLGVSRVSDPALRGPLLTNSPNGPDFAKIFLFCQPRRPLARFLRACHGWLQACIAGRRPLALSLDLNLPMALALCSFDALPCQGLPVPACGWFCSSLFLASLLLSLFFLLLQGEDNLHLISCRLLLPQRPLFGLFLFRREYTTSHEWYGAETMP